MTLPDREVVRAWIGARVLDEGGEEIGTCATVFADDSTGAAEWLNVTLADGRTAMVPIQGAQEEQGSVRIRFPRKLVESAPAGTSGTHLDVDAEKRLYDHYGVPYSEAESDTVLPAGETPAASAAAYATESVPPTPTVVDGHVANEVPDRHRPAASPHPHAAASPADRLRKVPRSAPLAIVGALAAFFTLRRLRRSGLPIVGRRRTTRSQRAMAAAALAAQSTKSRAVPALAAGGQLGKQALEASVPIAKQAGEGLVRGTVYAAALGTVAGEKAAAGGREAAHAVQNISTDRLQKATQAGVRSTAAAGAGLSKASRRTTRKAAKSAALGAGVAGRRGRKAARRSRKTSKAGLGALAAGGSSAVTSVTQPVANTAHRVHKTSSKLLNRTLTVAGLGTGYVLGARAGRDRYEQIVSKASDLAHRPEVEQVQAKARDVVGSSGGKHAGSPSSDELVDLTQPEPNAANDRP